METNNTIQPRKIYEILELAMPEYIKRCGEFPQNHVLPGMCNMMCSFFDSSIITEQEYTIMRTWIRRKLGNQTYLADKLKSQKKGSSTKHRIAWYQKQIQILKQKDQ